jgi:uncharacterized membrane protein
MDYARTESTTKRNLTALRLVVLSILLSINLYVAGRTVTVVRASPPGSNIRPMMLAMEMMLLNIATMSFGLTFAAYTTFVGWKYKYSVVCAFVMVILTIMPMPVFRATLKWGAWMYGVTIGD